MSNDSLIKNWKLTDSTSRKPFALSAGQTNTVKDKDNTQPVIPPPRVVFNPHPRLAPPGMMGSRLAKDAARFMDEKRAERAEERTFKPFAHDRSNDRSRGR